MFVVFASLLSRAFP